MPNVKFVLCKNTIQCVVKKKFKIQALYPNLVYVIKPAKLMTISSSFAFLCNGHKYFFIKKKDKFVSSFNAKDATYSHGDKLTNES